MSASLSMILAASASVISVIMIQSSIRGLKDRQPGAGQAFAALGDLDRQTPRPQLAGRVGGGGDTFVYMVAGCVKGHLDNSRASVGLVGGGGEVGDVPTTDNLGQVGAGVNTFRKKNHKPKGGNGGERAAIVGDLAARRSRVLPRGAASAGGVTERGKRNFFFDTWIITT